VRDEDRAQIAKLEWQEDRLRRITQELRRAGHSDIADDLCEVTDEIADEMRELEEGAERDAEVATSTPKRNPTELENRIAERMRLLISSAPWPTEHDFTAHYAEDVPDLTSRIDKLKAGLQAILQEHVEAPKAGLHGSECCTCTPQDKLWPCVTVLEARAALGED
jgi:hypothetical protein